MLSLFALTAACMKPSLTEGLLFNASVDPIPDYTNPLYYQDGTVITFACGFGYNTIKPSTSKCMDGAWVPNVFPICNGMSKLSRFFMKS